MFRRILAGEEEELKQKGNDLLRNVTSVAGRPASFVVLGDALKIHIALNHFNYWNMLL